MPSTIHGLEKRFTKLFREFWRDRKHYHRNELVLILDELLNRDAITRDTYKKINDLLAQSLSKVTKKRMQKEWKLILKSRKKIL